MPNKHEILKSERRAFRKKSAALGATMIAALSLAPSAAANSQETSKRSANTTAAKILTSSATSYESELAVAETAKARPPHKKHHPKHKIKHPKHHAQPETPAAPPLANLHPEKLSVPDSVKQIMDANVVYLPALGCSGFLIRNSSDVPVGVLTAQHCGMLARDGNQSAGSNGQVNLNFGQPIFALTGNTLRETSSVGQVDQFLLNSNNDNTRDQALGAFTGHSMSEVAASYQQMLVQNANVLKQGTVIYDSGWPVDQPNNPGAMERQDFAMSVLGPANWNITDGEQLNLLVAAVPLDSDGSECSWGASGSGGFIVGSNGKPLLVGPLSAFNDFGDLYNKNNPKGANDELNYIQSYFQADMNGYAAVCGFSVEPPSPQAGAFLATVDTPAMK